MAAFSPPRFFATWGVEAPLSAVSLFGGLHNLRSLSGSMTYVGGALLFNHLNNNEVVWIGTQVSTFLKAVFDVLPGIQDGLPLAHK